MLQQRSTISDHATRIAELSDEFLVRRVHEDWLIVGPSGLFVVGRAGADASDDANRTLHIAQLLRERLSLHMAWVPFVDVLLVSDRRSNEVGCSVVRPSMLESVLTDGHQRIELSTLFELRRLLPGLAQELTVESSRSNPSTPSRAAG
ncbi:MAG: hypothetical protein V9F03_13315 [Microthrixaceae bacterium]